MKRTFIASLIVGWIWLGALGAVAPATGFAQATPSTEGPAGNTDAACTLAPRQFDDIAALAGTPPAGTTPLSSDGAPAGAEIIAGVTETVQMAVACANANDPLRSYALFTDRYLAERFGTDHPDDLGSLYAALSREPTPAAEADRLALVEVRDVTTLAEGWVIATVVTANRATRYVDRLVFQLVGDQWLIDSWSPLDDGTPPAS